MLFLLLFVVPAVPIAIVAYFLMGSSLKSLMGVLFSKMGDTYNIMTDGELAYGQHYNVLRHSRPFVIYQGTKTTVTISVFGSNPLPSDRKVFLQERGWRTGLLGWSLGGALGGSHLPGVEVTPVSSADTDTYRSQLKHVQADIDRLVPASSLQTHPHQQTMVIHIPVAAGDGYFRLVITSSGSNPLSSSHKIIAESPSFRVGSITFSTAQPRGASLMTLPAELVLRSMVLAGRTAAFAAFYATFPFLKLASMMPGPWRQWAIRVLYQQAGGEERFKLQDRVGKMKERIGKANEQVYKTIPFGSVGVRTPADILKDEELGRQGIWITKLPTA